MPWKEGLLQQLACHAPHSRAGDHSPSIVHLCQLGRGLPFSSFPDQSIQAPQRVVACLEAFRQLQPHRLVSLEHMPYQEVIGQPLFHSRQITHLGEPIAWEHWARQGKTRWSTCGISQVWGSTASPAAEDDPAPGYHASYFSSGLLRRMRLAILLLFFVYGEGFHDRSFPIASVSAFLKDRYSKAQGIFGSTGHPMTREANSQWHESVQSDHLSWTPPSREGRVPHRQGTMRAGSTPEWEGQR